MNPPIPSMSPQTFNVCVDRSLTPIQPQQTARRHDDSRRLAADTTKLWKPHQSELHIRFLNGTPPVQKKVARFAVEWCQHANIQFIFDNNPQAPIRITFDPGPSWSLIGTDALDPQIGPDEPTINLSGLNSSTPNDEVSRVVLHEFGHALGLIHEHQNPAHRIQWNRDAVYDFYSGPPNYWSQTDVDLNLFTKYDTTLTNYWEFDPHSIMLYPIPPQFTLDGFYVGWNRILSKTDKECIALLYPRPDLQPGDAPSPDSG